MVINETKTKVTAVQLSGYEMNTLNDAKKTLNMLFNKVTSRDNETRCYNILVELDGLIEELEENNNSILEFSKMEE
jgi:hypothetical protein